MQSPEGLIYVGNGDGVLEYDGVSWRLIHISNRSPARSLAIDSEGRVFVGAVGELGYLAPGSLGWMRYVSLLEHIPAADRSFGERAALRSGQHYLASEGDLTVAGAQRALALLPPEIQSARGHAMIILAVSLQIVGELDRAHEVLYQILADCPRSVGPFQSRLLLTLCIVDWMAGDLVSMGQEAARLLRLGEGRLRSRLRGSWTSPGKVAAPPGARRGGVRYVGRILAAFQGDKTADPVGGPEPLSP